MVDPLHAVAGIEVIPGLRLIGHQLGAGSQAVADEGRGLAFRAEYCRKGVAIPLTDDDHALPLAVLVLGQPPIPAVLAMIGGLLIAAEIAAIDLCHLADAADHPALQLGCHRLAQLMSENEGRLVLNAEITAQRQRALALHLIDEDGDARQVVPQAHLVEGKQGAGGDGEVLAARLAAVARGAVRAAALIDRGALAMRADRLAIGRGPADAGKDCLGFLIRHPQHSRQGEATGFGRKEEVLRHFLSHPRLTYRM